MYVEALSLLTGFFFACNAILVRKGMKYSTPVTGALTVSFVQMLVLGTLLLRTPIVINTQAIFYFVLAGILATTVARSFNYIAIERLGVSVATSLTGVDPLFSSVLAIIFLKEPYVTSTLMGVILIVLGVMLMSGFNSKEKMRPIDTLIPITAAFFYALSNLVRKTGMGIHPDAVQGGLIAAITSLIAFPIYLAISGRLGEIKPTKESLPYFAGGGVVVSAAMITMYTAFSLGNISVVSPLIGASPIFSLILSSVLLRDQEKITKRIVSAALVIFLGVLMITIF